MHIRYKRKIKLSLLLVCAWPLTRCILIGSLSLRPFGTGQRLLKAISMASASIERFVKLFKHKSGSVIGMIHLRALPGKFELHKYMFFRRHVCISFKGYSLCRIFSYSFSGPSLVHKLTPWMCIRCNTTLCLHRYVKSCLLDYKHETSINRAYKRWV